jgi:RNA polymerase sigma factor (TIGR02999 family)
MADGDERAFAQLSALMYEELRQLAQRHLRRERSITRSRRRRSSTRLLRSPGRAAIGRLAEPRAFHWPGFEASVRRVPVDYARARLADKRAPVSECGASTRWPHRRRTKLPTRPRQRCSTSTRHTQEEVSSIDQALVWLEQIDERQAQIVEMRYFGGLTVEQTAEAMDISEATVKREWTLARAWLRRELGKSL